MRPSLRGFLSKFALDLPTRCSQSRASRIGAALPNCKASRLYHQPARADNFVLTRNIRSILLSKVPRARRPMRMRVVGRRAPLLPWRDARFPLTPRSKRGPASPGPEVEARSLSLHEFIARLVRVSIDNRSNRRDDKSISIMCRGFLRDNALCDHDRHYAAFLRKGAMAAA
jgi:hypothetical protein